MPRRYRRRFGSASRKVQTECGEAVSSLSQEGNSRSQRTCSSRPDYHRVADEIERVLSETSNTDVNQLDDGSAVSDTGSDESDCGEEVPIRSFPRHSSFINGPRLSLLQTNVSNETTGRNLRRFSLPSSLRRRNRSSNAAQSLETSPRPRHVSFSNLDTTRYIERACADNDLTEDSQLESSINTYTLFESAGGRNLHRRRQANNRRRSSNIIYDTRKYGPGLPGIFKPILMFLSTTFALLVVLRMLINLLTSIAIGWALIIGTAGYIINEFVRRPIRLFRRLHARPLLSWAILGGLARLLTKVALPEIWMAVRMDPFPTYFQQCIARIGISLPHIGEVTDSTSPTDGPGPSYYSQGAGLYSSSFDTQQDLVAIWSILEGVFFGTEIGALWLVLLGNAAEPSYLALWLYHKVWRPVRRHYRESIREQRRLHLRESLRLNQNRRSGQEHQMPDSRRQCMICLDGFAEDDYEEPQSMGDLFENSLSQDLGPNISSLYRRQYLKCKHSFHAHCIQEWLLVNASCPICRISLDDAISEDASEASTAAISNGVTTNIG